MASMTSTLIATEKEVLRARFAARFPMRMAPPMCVAQRPETMTSGVQGTATVGEMASATAFATCLGVLPLSSVRAAVIDLGDAADL